MQNPLGKRDVALQRHVRMADVPVRELFELTTQDGPHLVDDLAQRLHRRLSVTGSTEGGVRALELVTCRGQG